MSRYVYPAVFTKEENGLYSVNFPDFTACFTQGDGVADAMEMGRDVLEITLCDMEDEKKAIPTPSDPATIKTDGNSFATLICGNTLEYRKKYGSKAVKKTLTIPEWLNTAAERKHVNFSAVLQQALIEQLNIG